MRASSTAAAKRAAADRHARLDGFLMIRKGELRVADRYWWCAAGVGIALLAPGWGAGATTDPRVAGSFAAMAWGRRDLRQAGKSALKGLICSSVRTVRENKPLFFSRFSESLATAPSNITNPGVRVLYAFARALLMTRHASGR